MRLEHGRLHRLLIMANLECLSCWFSHESRLEHCIFNKSELVYSNSPHYFATDTQTAIFKKANEKPKKPVCCEATTSPAWPLDEHRPRKPRELWHRADWGACKPAHSGYFLETPTTCLRLFSKGRQVPFLRLSVKSETPGGTDLCPILRKKKGLKNWLADTYQPKSFLTQK